MCECVNVNGHGISEKAEEPWLAAAYSERKWACPVAFPGIWRDSLHLYAVESSLFSVEPSFSRVFSPSVLAILRVCGVIHFGISKTTKMSFTKHSFNHSKHFFRLYVSLFIANEMHLGGAVIFLFMISPLCVALSALCVAVPSTRTYDSLLQNSKSHTKQAHV